jgi:LysR family hydrogen peroxide-inducible transcriptional activator
MVEVRPFAEDAPQRRVALAWRKSFPRLAAVEVLARAVRAARLECVTYIEPGR